MADDAAGWTPAGGGSLDGEQRADLSTVARGGVLNMVGALSAGVLNFVLVIVLTRGLGAEGVGAFFLAVALFSILSHSAELGADTGLVRMISRYRALGRVNDVRRCLLVAVVPVFVAGSIAAAVMLGLAPALSRLFAGDSDPASLVPYIRILAAFLPLSATYFVLLAGTRGFGTMVPSVVVDKLLKPSLQPLLVVVTVLAGLGAAAIALAWVSPLGAGFVVALLWLLLMLRRYEARAAAETAPAARPTGRLAGEFWRFTAPRGFAGLFHVTILWLDTLLVGALRSADDAGVYAAATRYLVLGSFVNVAIFQVVGPKVSELLARENHERALAVYQTATAWLMLLTWPYYLTLLVLTPAFLAIFGPEFLPGTVPLAILAGTMVVATACGPVDSVLLMGGKSSWSLFNTVVALVANVLLNLLLIPAFGITGAAVAWSASILVNNLFPLGQVWAFLRLHPFGLGSPIVGGAALLCFGVLGLLGRLAFGATVPVVLGLGAVGVPAYAWLVWRSRDRLQLSLLGDALRPAGRARAPR